MTITAFMRATALALMLAGPALAQDQTAPSERLDDRQMFASGEAAWTKTCARCHSAAEHAVGPDLIALEHDPDTLKFFARNGSGPMPAFTEAMIDDATLDAITAWVAGQYAGAQE